MKRRAFFGIMGGAAVAGPGMVKEAAAGLADLSLTSGLAVKEFAGRDYGKIGYAAQTTYNTIATGAPWHLQKWEAFQSLIGSAERLAKKRREFTPHHLDPDLVNCRSLSLGAKIRIQRDRDFDAWLRRERSWFDRVFQFGIEEEQQAGWY